MLIHRRIYPARFCPRSGHGGPLYWRRGYSCVPGRIWKKGTVLTRAKPRALAAFEGRCCLGWWLLLLLEFFDAAEAAGCGE